jgi:CRISPR-associated protein Cas2
VKIRIRMNYIVSYDISEDTVRKKVANKLLEAGCRRLQKSVFMAVDFSAKDIRQLKAEVLALVGGVTVPSNSVLCLPVSKKQKIEMWWEPPSDDPLPPKVFSMWI